MARKILTGLKNLVWFIIGFLINYLIFFCFNYLVHIFGWDLRIPMITVIPYGIVVLSISFGLWKTSKNFVYGLLLGAIMCFFGFFTTRHWV
ncbi:MAG: hypothetical protein WC546_01500 [Candidatus Omnitrophota bacterium]|jgi:hypothetical protein